MRLMELLGINVVFDIAYHSRPITSNSDWGLGVDEPEGVPRDESGSDGLVVANLTVLGRTVVGATGSGKSGPSI